MASDPPSCRLLGGDLRRYAPTLPAQQATGKTEFTERTIHNSRTRWPSSAGLGGCRGSAWTSCSCSATPGAWLLRSTDLNTSRRMGSHLSPGTRIWWRQTATSDLRDTRSIASAPTSSQAKDQQSESRSSFAASFGSTESCLGLPWLSNATREEPDGRTLVQFRIRESNWRPI